MDKVEGAKDRGLKVLNPFSWFGRKVDKAGDLESHSSLLCIPVHVRLMIWQSLSPAEQKGIRLVCKTLQADIDHFIPAKPRLDSNTLVQSTWNPLADFLATRRQVQEFEAWMRRINAKSLHVERVSNLRLDPGNFLRDPGVLQRLVIDLGCLTEEPKSAILFKRILSVFNNLRVLRIESRTPYEALPIQRSLQAHEDTHVMVAQVLTSLTTKTDLEELSISLGACHPFYRIPQLEFGGPFLPAGPVLPKSLRTLKLHLMCLTQWEAEDWKRLLDQQTSLRYVDLDLGPGLVWDELWRKALRRSARTLRNLWLQLYDPMPEEPADPVIIPTFSWLLLAASTLVSLKVAVSRLDEYEDGDLGYVPIPRRADHFACLRVDRLGLLHLQGLSLSQWDYRRIFREGINLRDVLIISWTGAGPEVPFDYLTFNHLIFSHLDGVLLGPNRLESLVLKDYALTLGSEAQVGRVRALAAVRAFNFETQFYRRVSRSLIFKK